MSKEVFTTYRKTRYKDSIWMQRKRFQTLKQELFWFNGRQYGPEAVVPVAGNEELMAMSEFIRNLDVSLKLFLLLRDWFYIYYAKRSTTA
jgi:hypothetical protein